MSSETKTQDWSKPAAMAIPKGGYFQDKVEQGRYGPIFPKTPASYGFSIVAKIIPGREGSFYEHAKSDRRRRSRRSRTLWRSCNCTTCAGCSFPSKAKRTSCTRAFSTPTSINTPRMLSRYFPHHGHLGLSSKISRDFPMDWKTNPGLLRHSLSAIINARASSNTAEYPFVSATEVKKALKLKAAFSEMLDQMQ